METHSIDSTESNTLLKHELGLIERSSLLSVFSWLCGIISISKVRGGGFETQFFTIFLDNSKVRGGGFETHFFTIFLDNSVDSGLIERSSLLSVFSWLCGIISISKVRGGGFETQFFYNFFRQF